MLLDLSGLTREELLKPSPFHIHAVISKKVSDERRAKAKTGSNLETIQTLVGLAEKAIANTLAAENLKQVLIARTVLLFEITIMMWMMMMRKNDTFSSYYALHDVTVLVAAELDAIALLADTGGP